MTTVSQTATPADQTAQTAAPAAAATSLSSKGYGSELAEIGKESLKFGVRVAGYTGPTLVVYFALKTIAGLFSSD